MIASLDAGWVEHDAQLSAHSLCRHVVQELRAHSPAVGEAEHEESRKAGGEGEEEEENLVSVQVHEKPPCKKEQGRHRNQKSGTSMAHSRVQTKNYDIYITEEHEQKIPFAVNTGHFPPNGPEPRALLLNLGPEVVRFCQCAWFVHTT